MLYVENSALQDFESFVASPAATREAEVERGGRVRLFETSFVRHKISRPYFKEHTQEQNYIPRW
jgi:hypothetical protein